ncbi:hypothetical protein GCM10023147_24340 [Tsukamurella soli]|uniref:Peptidase C45 hydrolase domain-containing protein n=1 Tax=Tsukamurella soli TaxID=644556 RepID=A0ABP8JNA1_9ACTN
MAASVDAYRGLFDGAARAAGRIGAGEHIDLAHWGGLALARIDSFAPELGAEIRGIAGGAALPVYEVAAINARTEILAACGAAAHECSTVVRLIDGAAPVSVQCWDWYSEFADLWLLWEIPRSDGGTTVTVTEFGIVGKAGVNGRGLGLHFNILHHEADGSTVDGGVMGVPVHVLARAVLDRSLDLNQAMVTIAAAPVSASTSLTLVAAQRRPDGRVESAAVSCEVNPEKIGYALPDPEGLLVHTNHFLSEPARLRDTELVGGPDTVIRYDQLRRRLVGRDVTVESAVAAMDSHLMGGGATCCHPDSTLPPPAPGAARAGGVPPAPGAERAGRVPPAQFATLATIALDVPAGTVRVHAGGPCTAGRAFTAETSTDQYKEFEHA